MEMSLGARLKHAWNVFTAKETVGGRWDIGPSNYYRPDRPIFSRGNERSIISVYNRIALDVAAITIQHVRLDDEGRFTSVMDSSLNDCLSLEANIDQTGRAFIQDVVQSMLDEGCDAIVPVDTDLDPKAGHTRSKQCEPEKSWSGIRSTLKFVSTTSARAGRKMFWCRNAPWPLWRIPSMPS